MKKRIALLMAVFLGVGNTAFAYIEKTGKDTIEYCDFETENPKFDIQGIYSLEKEGNNSFIRISSKNTGLNSAPGYSMDVSGTVTIEFDNRSLSYGQVYIQFNNEEYIPFFTIEPYRDGNGVMRGSRVIDEKGNGWYLYGSDCPDVEEWCHYKIVYNTRLGTVNITCNDKEGRIGEFRIKDYWKQQVTPENVTFKKARITGIRFGNTEFNNGYGSDFDNIKISGSEDSDMEVKEDTQFLLDKEKLEYLGVTDDKINGKNMKDSVTKGEFITYAMKLIKTPEGVGRGDVFKDLKKENPVTYYAEQALERNLIEKTEKFNPNQEISLDEALNIMLNILKYAPKNMEEAKNISYDVGGDLLKGIKVKTGEQILRTIDMVTMFDNSLYIPMMKFTIPGEDEKEDETILDKFYNLKEEKVYIKKVNYLNANITALGLKNGNEEIYETKGVSLLNLEGTYRKLWIDEEGVVQFVTPIKNSQVAYGFVNSYNNGDYDTVVNSKKLNKIMISVLKKEFDTSEDFKIYKDDVEFSGEINPTGWFVRITVNDNEIVRMDVLDENSDAVKEGGIIKNITEENIYFKCGEETDLKLNLLNFKEYIAIINGREASFDKLNKDMVFDYYEKDGYLYILASDTLYSGVLKGSGSENDLKVDDKNIPLSDEAVYISADGGNHFKEDTDFSLYFNQNVKVMIDMKGEIKYLICERSGMYYGVVMGGYADEETEELMLKVSLITENSIDEGIYVYKENKNVIFYPEVSFYDALGNAKNEKGKGVYKFKIANGKITKIEAIDWANNGNMITMSGNVSSTYFGRFVASGKAWYFGDKIICLKDQFGEFNPQIIDVAKLAGRKSDGVNVLIEASKPMAEIVVMDDVYNNFYEPNMVSMIVSKIETVAENDEVYMKYTCLTYSGESVIKRSEEKPLEYKGREVKTGDIIVYAYNNLRNESDRMTIFGVVPYNDIKWGNFEKISYSNGEQVNYTKYIGKVLGFDGKFVKVQGENGIEWYALNSERGFYEYKNRKFLKAEQADVVGMQAYAYTQTTDIIEMLVVKE